MPTDSSDSADRLLRDLSRMGVELHVDEGKLRYRAPRGVLTGDVLTRLKHRKSDLIQLLDTGGQSALASEPAEQRPTELAASTTDTFFDFVSRKDRSGASAWQAERHPHSFARYVEPVKSFLLSRVGLDKEFVRGEGCTLYDEHGQSYLDFVSQYGALPFGYNPPEIWGALQRLQAPVRARDGHSIAATRRGRTCPAAGPGRSWKHATCDFL